MYGLSARHDRLGRSVREDCGRFRETGHGEEFMLALLTRQRDMLKTERFFNTFREHVAVYHISAGFALRWFKHKSAVNALIELRASSTLPRCSSVTSNLEVEPALTQAAVTAICAFISLA